MDIKITVANKIATAEDVPVVCGNSDYVLNFEFDSEWDEYETKTMRLDYLDGSYTDTVFSGTSCALPAVQNRYRAAVGVYAGDLHTTTPAILRCIRSITDFGGSPAAPSEDVYAQLTELLNRRLGIWYPSVSEDGVLSWEKSESDTAPESVTIKGEQGAKGDTGDTGVVSASAPLAYDSDSKSLSVNSASTTTRGVVKIGSGLTIDTGGRVAVIVDGELSSTSANPVQNASVYTAIQELAERISALEGSVGSGIEYSQVNDTVAAYMTASETYEDGGTDTVIASYADGTQLGMPAGYGSGYTGTMSVTGSRTYSYDISDSAILNLVPNEVSTVSVAGDSALSSIKLYPTGYVRMLNIGVYNVRDLGGWECDGGRVAYNKIIRGTQLVTSAGAQLVSDLGKNVLLNAIGIQAELNWQETSEDGAITESVLGSDIAFKRCPLNIDNGYSAQISGDNLAVFVEGVQWAMEQVIAGSPVYLHCSAGTDRTGISAFVLNAVLGVAEHDLDRDYELTRFGNIYNTTLNRGVANWTNFKTVLKSYTGDTLRDKVIYFLRSNDVAMDTINSFRAAMCTETPETLEDPIGKVNLIPTSVDTDFTTVYNGVGYASGYRTNSSGTLSAKDGYYSTGIMPYKLGQTMTFENMKVPKDSTASATYYAYTAIQYWNSEKTFIKQDYFYILIKSTSNAYTTDDSGYITSFTLNANTAGTDLSDIAYIRISCELIDDTSAIYVE